MSRRFEELAWAPTPMGEISLRRRVEPTLGVDVYEVRLGEEFLMSSLFTASEEALGRLGTSLLGGSDGDTERDVGPRPPWDVVVGGLGLGCTARAALEDDRVGSLDVVEVMPAVIGWHRDRLLPDSLSLVEDERCRLVEGDFFAMARGDGFDPERPGRVVDAVLLDIDHTPQHTLDPAHADLYTAAGLRRLLRWVSPGGVFGLWSDDPPHPDVTAWLAAALDDPVAHVIEFDNPLTRGRSAGTVYLGRRPTA